MRAVLHPTLLLAISAALFLINAPMRTDVFAGPKPNCCASHMAKADQHSRASHCPRTPSPEKPCCLICAQCLPLSLTSNPSFIASLAAREEIPDCATRAVARFDRPPVPPPRSSLV